MRPDETLPRADADPGQASARPHHPQSQSTGQVSAPKTPPQQQPHGNNHSSHHTQVATITATNTATIRRRQTSQPQQLQQQQEQEQQQPEAQLRRRQETEQERHARKSSSSTTQSSTNSGSRRQHQQSATESSNYNFAAPMAIQDHLMQAAHHAQALQQRNAELEAENRILKEAVQQHKLSAIDWCMTAKEYQQDRNMMTLRLEELEMELARMAYNKKADKALARAEKSNSTTAGLSSSSSHQQPSKVKTLAQTTKDYEDNDELATRHQFLSQSISQILDEMTPKQSEPPLPIHGKTHNGGQNQDADNRTSKLPSALKQSFKSSKCKCGCQEELRAWKTRCKYAENRATAQELRCEQMIVYKDAYKTKWTQWREDQIQQQYQQRMRAAMPFSTSRHMSPFQTASLQQQYLQQQQQYQGSLPISSYEGGFKRARFASEGSETSSQRQERTERNTIYNQITTSFVPGGQAERRKSSTNIRRTKGKGSAEEPHILVDRDDGSSSEGFVGSSTSSKRHRMEPTVLNSSNGNETPAEYENSAMSPTFPSDMTLRLRQYQLDSEDDDEGSDGYASPSNRLTFRGQSWHRQGSPNTPLFRSHEQGTLSRAQQQQQRVTVAPDFILSENHAPASLSDYASDRSSPPMFDTADFITQKSSARSHATATNAKISPAHRQAGREGSLGTRAGVMMGAGAAKMTIAERHHSKPYGIAIVPNGGRRNSSSAEPFTVYEDPDPAAPASVVLETPLELQGIRRDKPISTAKAVPEMIEIAEDDHAAPGQTSHGSDGGESGAVGVEDNDGRSDKENSPPKPGAIERRDSDGMMDFEEATGTLVRRDISPSKANVSEERIYNYTERRKNKRKLMHGHNCECCRRFYEITGPLPLPDGYSHFFQPIPRPGDKEVWEKTDEERLQDRIQQVSRHRVHHMPPLTPPGYWNTDFPSTPERKKWDEIDRERRERKRHQESHQAEKQQRQRRGAGGGGSSSRAGPSGVSSRSNF
ncbi:hypothetical protein BG015_003405 [Linnemannia schmuckeri]|uniref:DNA endonuclease activator Ctp1 C-terminal domain-containing protein n=1 Tax=Linnemannia schmuckeri TaxID=64567 RepID=A0A9P5VD86_9FUNG|nr:hypothetical protein BG015_003405 [Linnemannia schmuckeri]